MIQSTKVKSKFWYYQGDEMVLVMALAQPLQYRCPVHLAFPATLCVTWLDLLLERIMAFHGVKCPGERAGIRQSKVMILRALLLNPGD